MPKEIFRKFSALLMLSILLNSTIFFGQVKVTEKLWTLPTYKVAPGEKAPIFFSNESFQGARRVIYPYALNDVISHDRVNQDWKALMLENEYIELCITPDIGGKIYYATDKTNGYNFLYKNNEVKPSNIGMTGAWVSGGIEWCVLHHHRASTMLPMDYTISENENGSKTIFIGEIEPRHRMRWNVAVTLKPGKSYFEAELTIYNPTPYTNTFLNWANVATHVNENYQTIFPESVQLATFHSKNQFTRWPISTEVFRTQDFTSGVDVSWWKNVKKNASFFAWDLKEDFMGGYDHGQQSGTVHIGDHNIIKGAKLWEWGSGPVGQATEARLTETSGPYVEIMVGAFSDNQPDYTWIRPYETKTWKQYWYPVRDIGGFKNANIDAAVNLEQRADNKVFLGYYSTQKLTNAQITLRNGDKIISKKNIEISPAKSYTEIITINTPFKLTDLSTEMIDLETNKTILAYQPVELKSIEKLPEPVDKPDAPEDVSSVEELFIIGSRKEQFYKNPTEYYDEVLKRDPFDTRTNTAIGNRLLKDGDYENARKYFSVAINRLVDDYTRPSTGEALYLQGVTLKALELYDDAIDTLYRATWDYAYHSAGYFELTQISCVQGDFKKALHQINESLSTNMKNNRAIALKASILRKLKKYDEASKTLSLISESDPLNFRAENEAYLITKESGEKKEAQQLLASLTKLMRDFDQNYIELAVGYVNEGMYDEAEDVLLRFKGENPIVQYYLGEIHDKKGNKEQAKIAFEKAQSLSEDNCFPFRLETIKILETALLYNSKDGKAYYYLGNILYNKQPAKAIAYWEESIKYAPTLAMAFRNLGWGYYRHYEDLEKAIPYYEKAISLDDSMAIFYAELDNIYMLNNAPISTRLAIFDESNSDVIRVRDDAFISQVTVLTLAGKPDLAVKHLVGKEFSFREGNSRVREVIIDAQLTLGINYFEEKNYQKALEHFLLAQVPDEEAGSARSGNRNLQINYFIGLAYEALKDPENAKKYFTKATLLDTPDPRRKSKIGGFMNYYQGLSYLKLGDKEKANQLFNTLVETGNEQIKDSGEDDDYFQIFGEKENENTQKSMAYTLRGLGYKGLGEKKLAKEDLTEATNLLVSNLWANTELNSL